MYLTSEILKAKGACADQVNIFSSLYPEGVEITLSECLKHATTFDWHWAARNFLSAGLVDTYNARVKPIKDTYDAQVQSLGNTYAAQVQALWNAQEAQVQSLWNIREAQVQALWNTYAPRYATLFFSLLEKPAERLMLNNA